MDIGGNTTLDKLLTYVFCSALLARDSPTTIICTLFLALYMVWSVYVYVCFYLPEGGSSMDTLLTGMVEYDAKEKKFKAYVNGIQMEVDEVGGFEINVTKLIALKSMTPNIMLLQNDLEITYTKEQILDLFHMWGSSGAITISDVASILGVDKHTAKDVLQQGIHYKVLCRGHNSVWKGINKMIKTQLLSVNKAIMDADKPRRNAEDILHEKMDTWKKEREENEQSDNMSESISEEESEEPAQIKVGMKGESKRTGKGTVKSMSELAKQQTPSLVVLPKKKPLQIPTQAQKKSHKPAKT